MLPIRSDRTLKPHSYPQPFFFSRHPLFCPAWSEHYVPRITAQIPARPRSGSRDGRFCRCHSGCTRPIRGSTSRLPERLSILAVLRRHPCLHLRQCARPHGNRDRTPDDHRVAARRRRVRVDRRRIWALKYRDPAPVRPLLGRVWAAARHARRGRSVLRGERDLRRGAEHGHAHRRTK